MFSRSLLSAIFTFCSFALFAQNSQSFLIKEIKVIEIVGERLEEAKADGLSGKAYKVDFENDFAIVEKEDLELLSKFRGLEITEDLIGMKVSGKVRTPAEALHLEILNARKKGHYVAPTEDEFIAQLADDFLNSDKHCPRIRNFIDTKTSLKYGRNVFKSAEGKKHFEETLLQKLQAKDKSASIKLIETCPDSLGIRTMHDCYEVKSDGKLVTTFVVAPVDGAGIKCVSANPEVPPGAGKRSKLQNGDKNEP